MNKKKIKHGTVIALYIYILNYIGRDDTFYFPFEGVGNSIKDVPVARLTPIPFHRGRARARLHEPELTAAQEEDREPDKEEERERVRD